MNPYSEEGNIVVGVSEAPIREHENWVVEARKQAVAGKYVQPRTSKQPTHHNCTSHVVVDRHQIAIRIAALASRMADDYLRMGTGYFKLNQKYVDRALLADDKGLPPPPKEDLVLQEPILLICVLKGSIIFTADLARALCDAGIATEIEFMKLSSYDGTKSTGKVSFSNGPIDAVLEKCVNRHVVIVEDILDTGRTLKLLIDMISDRQKAKGNAKKSSVKTCVMLDKPEGRDKALQHIKADYICFTIPKEFVVGYGLDFNQALRDLPDIAVFKQDFYIEPVELRKIRRKNKL
jgi:hypoxanthine phosphoribosyltransferase